MDNDCAIGIFFKDRIYLGFEPFLRITPDFSDWKTHTYRTQQTLATSPYRIKIPPTSNAEKRVWFLGCQEDNCRMQDSPKANLVRMWLSYHRKWILRWCADVRSPHMFSHLLSSCAGLISAMLSIYYDPNPATWKKLYHAALIAIGGYAALMLAVAIAKAFGVSSKMDYEQGEHHAELLGKHEATIKWQKKYISDIEKHGKEVEAVLYGLQEETRQTKEKWGITEQQLYEARTQLVAANEKISLLEQIPANISVEILELQRRAIDSQQDGIKAWKYDIFVRAKLELKNLGSIAISQMCVELSLQGALEIPQEKKDIESWRLVIYTKKDGGVGWAYHRIKPLKEELTQGVPEEGWLHYVTNRTTDEELDGSSLKLIVETSRGASHAELEARTDKWSPWGSGRIVPDPDTTNIGLPNIAD
jgi:hypothetical protein